jgi:hypothetical protein
MYDNPLVVLLQRPPLFSLPKLPTRKQQLVTFLYEADFEKGSVHVSLLPSSGYVRVHGRLTRCPLSADRIPASTAAVKAQSINWLSQRNRGQAESNSIWCMRSISKHCQK